MPHMPSTKRQLALTAKIIKAISKITINPDEFGFVEDEFVRQMEMVRQRAQAERRERERERGTDDADEDAPKTNLRLISERFEATPV